MYNLTNRTLYMLIGLPASGKSTGLLKATSLLEDAAFVLSTDNYIEAEAWVQGKTYTEVFKDTIEQAEDQMYIDLSNVLEDENVLVMLWDQTNLRSKARMRKLENVPDNVTKIAVVFECNEPERQRRLGQRSAEGKHIPPETDRIMVASFEEPTLSEGYHSIITGEVFETMFEQVGDALEKSNE
jgi:predicted kinase